jgi:hypothetical protein
MARVNVIKGMEVGQFLQQWRLAENRLERRYVPLGVEECSILDAEGRVAVKERRRILWNAVSDLGETKIP